VIIMGSTNCRCDHGGEGKDGEEKDDETKREMKKKNQ